MDHAQKVAIFRESLGSGVDVDFAESVLAAHDGDLQAALNTVLGDGGGFGGSSAPAPAPARRPEVVDAEGYRAPMRTGYTDTLMAPITPGEERRRQAEREAEQRRLEEQLAADAEARRVAAERARHEEQARQVEEQRKEAERLALERRRRRQDEEAQQRSQQVSHAPPAAPPQQPVAPMAPAAVPVPSPMLAAAPAAAAAPTPAQQALAEAEVERMRRRESQELQREREAAEARQREAEAAAAPAKIATDGVVQAIVALRKRYKEENPAGLLTCLQTLRIYINNLARNPHEPKFQRINCDNNAFRTRVGAFEGAVAVLVACGFREEAGALAVGPDFVKTKGSKTWDALAKVDVMIEQLKGGA